MVWNAELFVFASGLWLVTAMEGYYPPLRGSSVWGYFTPPLLHREPPNSYQSPMDAMVDLTNNLGVAILQDNTFSRGNFAFSPYGVASVLVVLYEGARGESARQIHRAVGFPSDKDIIRVGFRDIHRHLRSYFSHEGYLSGISLNKETSSLKTEYKRILRFYGYDIDLGQTLEDEDDDVSLGKPSAAAPTTEAETNRTTVSITLSDTSTPISTTSEDVRKPDSADLVTEKTTAVVHTGSGINTTTVSTAESATNAISTTVSPTERPEAATGQNSAKPSTTTDGVNLTQNAEPEITTVESPVQNTPISEPDAATDKSPPDDAKPQNATEETTVEPTTKQTTANEQETIGSTTTPKSQTTEIIKATTTLNLTTESDTKTTTTTTTREPTKYEAEHQTATTEIVSSISETQHGQENKEASPAVMESTTANLKEGANVPDLSSGQQQQQMSATSSSKDEVTEAVTEAETTVNEPEMTTTEGVKTEEFTNSPLDNGMLIPQAEDFVNKTATEKNSEPPATSTSPFREEEEEEVEANNNTEGTTDSHPQGTDSLPQTERRSIGKNVIKMSGKIPNPEEEKRIRNIVDTRVPLWLIDTGKPRKVRTITDYLKSPRSPDLSLQLQNGMYDTHVSRNADLYRSLPRMLFLVDGAIDTPVPMMTYTNVFPYAYIPKLHSKALEFPLDDVRYKLLILLPVERRGLRQLIYDLLDYPLSNVLAAMKPARVKATVPTFMVEGFVILTSSLQKLGIWDVFDPRKANLSGMSMDPELYVRNVEQSVTVVIRNYVEILDIQTRTMAARYMEYEFEATHPFLYFVLDTSTNVALMAGQILDPLNSRIY